MTTPTSQPSDSRTSNGLQQRKTSSGLSTGSSASGLRSWIRWSTRRRAPRWYTGSHSMIFLRVQLTGSSSSSIQRFGPRKKCQCSRNETLTTCLMTKKVRIGVKPSSISETEKPCLTSSSTRVKLRSSRPKTWLRASTESTSTSSRNWPSWFWTSALWQKKRCLSSTLDRISTPMMSSSSQAESTPATQETSLWIDEIHNRCLRYPWIII